MKLRRPARLLRRAVQLCGLGLFLWLLPGAAWPLREGFLPPDLFLRLDPLAALGLPLALRGFIPSLLPGLGLLLLAVLFGRVFCGYICPLGTTLDLSRLAGGLFTGREKKLRGSPSPRLNRVKYLLLAVLLGAALAGVNLIFWGSPLALITRFYSLLLHPLLLLAADFSLESARPLLTGPDPAALAYLSISPRRFDSMYFLLFFFGLLFVLEQIRPRFWCSCLCPAGALLGLCSLRPLWRRKVASCKNCGQCARLCPGGAISAEDPLSCAHSECFACRACVDICPVRGTSFSFERIVPENIQSAPPLRPSPPFPPRRAILGMAGAGAILASVQYSGLYSLLRPAARGNIWPAGLLRPPGSLPEAEFLLRCLRCGECMKACPTNGLQPAGPAFGAEALFSPVLLPRRGPCEPECNLCGRVCPSGAIAPLPPEEKQWAKVGTAVVLRQSCLAWAEGRRCVVCQEVCPYGAVSLSRQAEASVPVPLVRAARCFGCGYCEQHCPVRLPAIVAQPLNALRLAGGSYAEAAREAGLELVPGSGGESFDDFIPEGELPPGFTE
jgi:MauM/NapG family ferredoxin protein